MAQVAKRSGILQTTIKKMVTIISAQHTRIAMPDDSHGSIPNHKIRLMATKLEKVAICPADKSNPPTAMVIVSPMAITVMMEIALKIFVMFATVKNLPGMFIAKKNNNIIIANKAAQSAKNVITEKLPFLFARLVSIVPASRRIKH